MEVREQVAHLYRRFGLGASHGEVESGTALGFDGAVQRLIETPSSYEFSPRPYEFVWYDRVDPDCAAEYFRRWWLLRILCSRDPLADRMALFWHSHFAVSGEKVQFGPMMLDYLEAIQAQALGRFRDLLGAVVTTPALMEYLDMSRSLKGHPNENFPRELMELYSLGIGKYSEEDVRAAARCFTGWGYVNTYFDLPGNNREKVEDAVRSNRPFAAFAPMPAMHDDGEKTLLGQTGRFTSEEALNILAKHPGTADHVVGKLWAYFAYPNPDPAVLAPVLAEFRESDGDIRRTLAAIARTPAFLSPLCVRQKVKDPVDYTIGMMRATGIGPILLGIRTMAGDFENPLPQLLHIVLHQCLNYMDRQGMRLFFPPDPSGWKQGQVWASSDTMAARLSQTLPFATPDHDASAILEEIRRFIVAGKPRNGAQALARMCQFFDWDLTPGTRQVIVKAWAGNPGQYLGDLWAFWPIYRQTMHLVAVAPETHFC